MGVTQGRIRHQLATESQRCVSRRRLKSITQLHLHRLRPFLVLKGAHLSILGPEGHRTSSFGRTKNVRADVALSCKYARCVPYHFGFGISTFELCSRIFSRARVPLFLERARVHFFSSSQNSIPMGIAKYKTLILMEYGEYGIWNIYDVEEERATRSVWEYGI